MVRLVALDRTYWPNGGYGHWCPGCGYGHEIDTEKPNGSGAKWKFDGDMQCPTFTPSVNIRSGRFADPKYTVEPGETDHSSVCHYFITTGNIQFLGDCTHALAGKTVPLPEIPDGKYLTSRRRG